MADITDPPLGGGEPAPPLALTEEQLADLAFLDTAANAALTALVARDTVLIDAKEVSKEAYAIAQAMLDRHKAYQPG